MSSTLTPPSSVERTGLAKVWLPDDVEAYVCDRLADLGRAVVAAVPGAATKTIASHGGTLYLNCYEAVTLPGVEEDLVATVTYRNNLGRFVVTVAVLWDESGREVWARQPVEVNPNDPAQVGRALRAAADDIGAQSALVAGAMS